MAVAYIRVQGVHEVQRNLARLGLRVSDLDFRAIANEGMRLAARFAPARSGALRASIKASSSNSKAVVRAGGGALKYAGVINYGWGRRNIKPAHFLQRADAVLRRTAPADLQRQLNRIIRTQGMS